MEGGVPALLYAPNFGELRQGEVRRIHLPRTPVNRPSAAVLGFACWQHDGNMEVGRYTPSRLRKG
jgi:hypothetical protein